jgi:arylsulfatase A-like enzyme
LSRLERWSLCARCAPWDPGALPLLDEDVWELYAPDDWTQARALAAEQPERLAELQRLWLIEVGK